MLKSLPLLALLAAGGPLAAQLSGKHTLGGPDGHDTSTPQHQYAAEGYCTVSLTAENAYGKANYVEQIYVFLPKVAVSASTEATFRVYSNPIFGRFRVELEASLAGAVGEACFINSSGQTLRCQPVVGASTIELDAGNLPAGSCLLTLRLDDRLLKQQILITH